jgi:hypothetical protein
MTATLRGRVADFQNAAIAGAMVKVENSLTGFRRATTTDAEGAFIVTNIPLQSYTVAVEHPGFESWRDTVPLRSNIPHTITVVLNLAAQATRVEVNASEVMQLVDVESTGTRTELNTSMMSRMPVAPSNRGLEAMLMSAPGFAANANGAIHPRGAHNQMTYVVDGMPISDQLTGAFANAVDPAVVQTVELFTGNVPAEFGSKVSGVAVITTQSGMGSGRQFSGSTQVIGGGFDTLGTVTQFTGGGERWGYFGSFNAMKTNRYLDQVSIDNLHNGGNAQRAFGRFDYTLTSRDQLRTSVMAGRSSFQLANLRSQHASGQDQRQWMGDTSLSLGWLRTLSSSSTVDTNVSFRSATAKLFDSGGDTPVTATQNRTLTTFTAGTRWNRIAGRHNWRVGVDVQRFPVEERFTFAITDPRFNDPASDSFIPTLFAHDLSRGGVPFRFAAEQTGGLYSEFLQDTIRLGRLVATVGLRYDNYRFLASGSQLQPRVGFAFHIRETETVLRASYNRTYQTPPNENLLLSNSAVAAVLVPDSVRETLGGGFALIRPERQNVFEAGLQQGIGNHVSLNAAFYHKNSTDMQDNDNFFNTGIIFPTSLARSRSNGAEGRITVLPVRGFSGSLSMTHYHTIVDPPFTGGLFLGSTAINLLSAGPFVIDHDQVLGVHALVQYNVRKNLWVSTSVRYDSGLVSNPSDPVVVARDQDYNDLLPYVDLNSNPARVRPRTVTDIAIGYERSRGDRRFWDAVVQISNVTNGTALYNFQSIFVGTRLIQPRAASVKLRFWF